MKKRIISLFLVAFMIVGMIPLSAITAFAEEETDNQYVVRSWDGTKVTEQFVDIPAATTVTSTATVWETGWYVVDGTVDLSSARVGGDVNLILMDGCKLTVGGIVVTGSDSLTIYAQKGGTGELISKASADNYAGIGGGSRDDGGIIAIHGGKITATGGNMAAGIGGGFQGACGDVVIYGGEVTAAGGFNGAGIGTGSAPRNTGGSIAIFGGKVTVSTSDNSAMGDQRPRAIGGGFNGSVGTITVNSKMEVKDRDGNTVTLNNTWAETLTGAFYTFLSQPVVEYLYYDEAQQKFVTGVCDDYTLVTSDTKTLSAGWYVVTGKNEVPGKVTVSGEVHLILEDESTLKVNGTISGENAYLFIHSQSTEDKAGKLEVKGADGREGPMEHESYEPAGDGESAINVTELTVDGAALTVSGGMGGNGGIWLQPTGSAGGYGGTAILCEKVTLNTCIVKANGGKGGDGGIGTRDFGDGGRGGDAIKVKEATVNNSNVTATGGIGGLTSNRNGKSIGGFGVSSENNFEVNGGVVTVNGGNGGVGCYNINGYNGSDGNKAVVGGTLIINSGIVTATGGTGGNGGDGGFNGQSHGDGTGGSGGIGAVGVDVLSLIVKSGIVTVTGGNGGNGGCGSSREGGEGGTGGDAIFCRTILTVTGDSVTAEGGEGGTGGDGSPKGASGKEGKSVALGEDAEIIGTVSVKAVEADEYIPLPSGESISDYQFAKITKTLAAAVPYRYYDEASGEFKTDYCSNYEKINMESWPTTWEDGKWYVVKGDVVISHSVSISGEVHLILTDESTLKIQTNESPLYVNGTISGENAHLYLHSQSTGNKAGQLICYGPNGPDMSKGGNAITVSALTIDGTPVSANGGNGGLGKSLKGGNAIEVSILTVNDATVTAVGGVGGRGSSGGSSWGAAERGGDGGSGIKCLSLIINEGSVYATGGVGGAGGKEKEGYRPSGAVGSGVTLNEGGEIVGTVSVKTKEADEYIPLPSGKSINDYQFAKIANTPHTHDFTGDYVNNGDGTHSRKCTGCEKLDTPEAHIYTNGVCICGRKETTGKYIVRSWDKDNKKVVSTEENIPQDAKEIVEDTTELDGGWYYVAQDIEISDRIYVNGTTENPTNIILTDGVTLNAKAGIEVNGNHVLNIYTSENDTGKIIAGVYADDYNYAAIGGGNDYVGGAITVYGGTVTAESLSGAGIGGGYKGIGGSFTIYGGTVNAKSDGGAGIGGGDSGAGRTFTMYGGTVTAKSTYGAGIGGGRHITVSGTINIAKNMIIKGGEDAEHLSVISKVGDEKYVVVDELESPFVPNFRASANEDGIRLDWDAYPLSSTSRYVIYTKDGENWKRYSSTSNCSITYKNAVEGETYTFNIVAIDAGKEEISSMYEDGLTFTYPEEITFNMAASIDDHIRVQWNAYNDAAKYKVYLWDNNTDTWKKITTVSTPAYNYKNVEDDKEYKFNVVPLDSDGKEIGVLSKDGISCTYTENPFPTSFTAKNVDAGIRLDWSKIYGASRYALYYQDGDKWTKISTTSNQALTFKNVEAGKTYKFSIRAMDENGNIITGYDKNGPEITR